MLRSVALGAEFLGNSLAAAALFRLVYFRARSAKSVNCLFCAFLISMAAFCLTNVGYALIISAPGNDVVGVGTRFEYVVESVQVVTFVYVTPVLLTLIVVGNILWAKGYKVVTCKIGTR